DLESKVVKGFAGGAGLFFSLDGLWIAAFGANGLQKLALSGGVAITITPGDGGFFGGTWGDGDVIYFVPELPNGIASIPADGGQPTEVVKIEFETGQRQHKYPYAIPGTNSVLLTTAMAENATFDDARISVFSRINGRVKVLIEGGTHP